LSRVLRLKREERAGVLVPVISMPAVPPVRDLGEAASEAVAEGPEAAGGTPGAVDVNPEEASRMAAELLEEAKKNRDAMLESARKEAQDIVERAEAEREQVLERGYRQGYEAGYKEGLEQAAAEGETVLVHARQALEDARSSLPLMLEELEPRILALCLEICRKVLERELREDPSTILNMARQGLKALKDEREFSLRVNPSLVALLDGSKDELVAEFSPKSIEVIGDDEIPPDGVIVKTPHGLVDARIDTQITNIARAIAELRRRATPQQEGAGDGAVRSEKSYL